MEKIEAANTRYAGTLVTLTDEYRRQHPALITRVWNVDLEGEPNYVNVVYVSKDSSKTDQYGNQIERSTSVGIKNEANAGAGRYFEF